MVVVIKILFIMEKKAAASTTAGSDSKNISMDGELSSEQRQEKGDQTTVKTIASNNEEDSMPQYKW